MASQKTKYILLGGFVFKKYGNEFDIYQKIENDEKFVAFELLTRQRYCIQIGFYKMQTHSTKI